VETGSAALIIAGKIKVQHGEIERFETDGLRMKNDTFVPADIVVLATGTQGAFWHAACTQLIELPGFGSMREACLKIFGDKVVRRTGPVWGLDEQFEPAGVWRYSGHPG
jgi:hypothetical protein